MLTAYLNATRRLLQNPSAPTALYSDADLTVYINTARGQLAGESESIRRIGTLTTTAGTQAYNFSSLTVSPSTGVDGVIHVRRLAYGVGDGQRWLTPRSWEWFDLYDLNNPVPTQSFPRTWSQYAQGAAPGATGSGASGSFYISPPPDTGYVLYADCVCYPDALALDADPEAIPYLWTDCVPFFAAYYALLGAQSNARMADAERFYNHYQTFLERARKAANPSVNRWMYQQSLDPAQMSKLGMQKPAQPNGGQG